MNKYKINSHNKMQPVDSKSRYVSYNSIYDLTNFYDFKNKCLENNLKHVKDLIKNGMLKMNIEKQNKHYIGSNNYKYNKSYFICSQKDLNEMVIKNIDNA